MNTFEKIANLFNIISCKIILPISIAIFFISMSCYTGRIVKINEQREQIRIERSESLRQLDSMLFNADSVSFNEFIKNK